MKRTLIHNATIVNEDKATRLGSDRKRAHRRSAYQLEASFRPL